MREVLVHIYDVTNSSSVKMNAAIVQMNRFMRDGIGLGGIFHSAIQVYGEEEWSFGYCDSGTGVFSCQSKENPMYTYRETISLGWTTLSPGKAQQILTELSSQWSGISYDLLSRNCNHFCDEFCEKLGVKKLPVWVNRFANAGDVAIDVAENTMKWMRQAKNEIVAVSKVAYRYVSRGGFPSSIIPDHEARAVSRGHVRSRNGGRPSKFLILKTRVNFISRNCLGYSGEVVEKAHVERNAPHPHPHPESSILMPVNLCSS